MLSESSFEIVCWRMLGCDTIRENKVVTSNDETKASHSALESFGLYSHVAHAGLDSFRTSRAKATRRCGNAGRSW